MDPHLHVPLHTVSFSYGHAYHRYETSAPEEGPGAFWMTIQILRLSSTFILHSLKPNYQPCYKDKIYIQLINREIINKVSINLKTKIMTLICYVQRQSQCVRVWVGVISGALSSCLKLLANQWRMYYNVHLLLPRFSHLVALTLPMRERQNSSYFSESLTIINIIFYIV